MAAPQPTAGPAAGPQLSSRGGSRAATGSEAGYRSCRGSGDVVACCKSGCKYYCSLRQGLAGPSPGRGACTFRAAAYSRVATAGTCRPGVQTLLPRNNAACAKRTRDPPRPPAPAPAAPALAAAAAAAGAPPCRPWPPAQPAPVNPARKPAHAPWSRAAPACRQQSLNPL